MLGPVTPLGGDTGDDSWYAALLSVNVNVNVFIHSTVQILNAVSQRLSRYKG